MELSDAPLGGAVFSPGMAFPAFGQHGHKGCMSASFLSLSFLNPSCDTAFLHLLSRFPKTHPYFLTFALVRILVAKNRNLSNLTCSARGREFSWEGHGYSQAEEGRAGPCLGGQERTQDSPSSPGPVPVWVSASSPLRDAHGQPSVAAHSPEINLNLL